MNRASIVLLLIAGIGCGPGSTARSGSLSLTQTTVGSTSSHVLSGVFLDAPLDQVLAGQYPGCTVPAQAGPCLVVRCAGASGTFFDAGTITASVAGTEVLSATPSASGSYSATAIGAVFTAGQTVSFVGTGGAVPAFAATVTAPEAPTATLPALIASSTDLVVTWNGTVAAEEAVLVIVSSSDLLSCRVPASDGTVTVATSLLTNFGPGPVSLALAAVNSERQTVGEYTIDFNATAGTGLAATIQ